MLQDKIDKAKSFIIEQIKNYNNPIVFSSFGKDSMVMLSLIKQCNLKLPILFHKEPFCPSKYEFSNTIILSEGYTVYDYPPLSTVVTKRGEVIEIVGLYQIGDEVSYMPTGIKKPKDDKFLCGLVDIYNKPKGSYNFPWDLGLIGHKASDKDLIIKNTELATNKYMSKNCDFIFPLIDFTDKDIWDYHERFKLRINYKRYNVDDDYKEFEDIDYNPDYFHACVACIDRDEPKVVYCPKLEENVDNVSHNISYLEPISLSYCKEN